MTVTGDSASSQRPAADQPQPTTAKRSRLGKFAVAAVIAATLGVWAFHATFRLNEPEWEAGHQGYVYSEYPYNSLNYLRFGYLRTGLGLVLNPDSAERPEKLIVRSDHGPILSLLMSFSYRLFGVYPWSARIVPLLLSLVTSILTGYLAWRFSGNRLAGLIAFVLACLAPYSLIYSRLPNPHAASAMFALATFACYWHWLHCEGRRRVLWAAGVIVLLILGVWTDWIAYFSVPAILGHYIFVSGRKVNYLLAAAFAATPFLLFGSFLAWATWLDGPDGAQKLLKIFLIRTASVSEHREVVDAGSFTANEYFWRSVRWFDYYLTGVVGGFGLICLAFALIAWLFRRRLPGAGLLLLLALYWLPHNLIFHNRVWHHDMIMVGHAAPFFQAAAACLVAPVLIWLWRRARVLALVPALVFGGIFLDESLGAFAWARQGAFLQHTPYSVAAALKEATPQRGSVLALHSFSVRAAMGDMRQILSVVDRNILLLARTESSERDGRPRTVHTLREMGRAKTVRCESLVELLASRPDIEAVVVLNSEAAEHQDFVQHCLRNYPRQDLYGYSIFRTRIDGPVALPAESPAIQFPSALQISNSLEYLGFDAKPVTTVIQAPGGWWRRHIQPFIDQLPRYTTRFEVTHYWRKTAPDERDLSIERRIRPVLGGSSLTMPDPGLETLFPTSRWPVGQVVRDHALIDVPPAARPGHFAVEVRVPQIRPTGEPAGFGDIVRTERHYQQGLRLDQVSVRRSGLRFWLAADGPVEQNYKAYIHVHSADDPGSGAIMLADAYPSTPTSQMKPGQTYETSAAFPNPLPPEGAVIRIGLFDERDPDYRQLVDQHGETGVWLHVRPVGGTGAASEPLAPAGAAVQPAGDGFIPVGVLTLAPPAAAAPAARRSVAGLHTTLGIETAVGVRVEDVVIQTPAAGPRITAGLWIAQPVTQDCRFSLRVGHGPDAFEVPLDLPSPLFWQPNRRYSAQATLSRWLQVNDYPLALTVHTSTGEHRYNLPLLKWFPHEPAEILAQLGAPDTRGDDVDTLRPWSPMRVRFSLDRPRELELILSWTGRSQFEQTRVTAWVPYEGPGARHVYEYDRWFARLAILELGRGKPREDRIRVPAEVTQAGENEIWLMVRRPTFVGWRRLLVEWLPQLGPHLRDSFVPYAGWIDLDFVQVRTRQ